MWIFWALFGLLAILGLIAAIILGTRYYERKRTEALAAAAAEIGLEFSADQDDALLEQLQVFALFTKGHSRKMRNLMTAKTDLAALTIFDYRFITGGGQHSQTHQQSVIFMQSDSLDLPTFRLKPEGFFDKTGAAIGFQDIDFDENPEFSKLFTLKGDDEVAIRKFFDAGMLQEFVKHQGVAVESAHGLFIYYQTGRKKPEEIQPFMTDGYAIYSAFADRLSRSSPPQG
ncbi:MAG: hypothetical protein VB912_02690 [Pirellulaceae bacterium]